MMHPLGIKVDGAGREWLEVYIAGPLTLPRTMYLKLFKDWEDIEKDAAILAAGNFPFNAPSAGNEE